MKIIIMGGGKLGFHLATNMLDRKYDVRLIERDRIKCKRLANNLDVEIIHGDGTGSPGKCRHDERRLLYCCDRHGSG